MRINDNLRRLIDANAPLWAGEAEIVRTYWTSPIRTRETDKAWLKRQCWKEYVGVAKFDGPTVAVAMCTELAKDLTEMVPKLDVTVNRHDLRELLDKVHAEFTHYCLFADVYDSLLEKGEPRINANELTVWPEEDALAKYRQRNPDQRFQIRACHRIHRGRLLHAIFRRRQAPGASGRRRPDRRRVPESVRRRVRPHDVGHPRHRRR